MEKQYVNVSIFGKSYVVSTDEGEEHVLSAAQMLDSLMKEVAEKVPTLSSIDVAILVSLQLAAEEKRGREKQDSFQNRVGQIVSTIEAEFDDAAAL